LAVKLYFWYWISDTNVQGCTVHWCIRPAPDGAAIIQSGKEFAKARPIELASVGSSATLPERGSWTGAEANGRVARDPPGALGACADQRDGYYRKL